MKKDSAKQQATCQHCGKSFEPYQTNFADEKFVEDRFCSTQCASDNVYGKQRGEGESLSKNQLDRIDIELNKRNFANAKLTDKVNYTFESDLSDEQKFIINELADLEPSCYADIADFVIRYCKQNTQQPKGGETSDLLQEILTSSYVTIRSDDLKNKIRKAIKNGKIY